VKCGGPLHVEKHKETTLCPQCGTGYLVNDLGGAFGLTEAVGTMLETKESFSRAASELALVRLKEEINASKCRINSLTNERQELEKNRKIAAKNLSTKPVEEDEMTRERSKKIGNIIFLLQIMLIALSGIMIVEKKGDLWFLVFGIVVLWWLLSSSNGSKKVKNKKEEQESESLPDPLTTKMAELETALHDETVELNQKLVEEKFHQDNVRLKG
jgi:hypothetical protein